MARARLSKDFADPTKPTKSEILGICHRALEDFNGGLDHALKVVLLYNKHTQIWKRSTSGIRPARRFLDKLVYQELGHNWFILYQPMIPSSADINQYQGKVDDLE
ncbi:hypothetical protein D9757_003709 [Collybiopsis confluens]|uniref:Uncharacterized protein n=1 Tax=Collybiopsis confluens TaxID=2823264 RepID=A0A8H5HUP7_9AGAR|nr:hypothetical protein D9757_003709 [Collybiopsis confluens]